MEEFEFLQAHDTHEKHINHRSAASSKGALQQRAQRSAGPLAFYQEAQPCHRDGNQKGGYDGKDRGS